MITEEQKRKVDEVTGIVAARVVQVELGLPLPALSAIDDSTGRHYERALSLVRLHS